MMKLAVLLASAAINASAIPAVASECASSRDIDAFRARWATLRTQPTKTADNEATCRAYAASFYESVTLRQATALCNRDMDQSRHLVVLDSEIDAFNDLLATKCGG